MVATEEPLRFRTALIFLILAIGLGAYAYFVERPARERESGKGTLLTLDSEAVEEIALAYPGNEIRLTKGPDTHWRIAAPIEADADQFVVKNLVDAISKAELTRTIEEPSQDAALYGLDVPTVTIRLRLADGTKPPALLVGKQTPIGFKAYVQKEGDPNVYLTTGSFHSGVKKEVKDLRNKTVVDFVDNEVETITLARKGAGPLVLRKTGDAWRITDPSEHAADDAEVRSFFSSLRGLRAQDFIDAQSDALGKYGLDDPRLRVTLSIGKDGAQKSVLLGSEAPGPQKHIYAKRAESATIYLVGDWVFKSLDKDANAFRDRTVLGFERDEATQITVTPKDGDPFTLERAQSGLWAVKGSDKKPDEKAINRFVEDLAQTKPAEIVSEDAADFFRYGLHDPDLRISVVGKNGEAIGTLLATRHAEGGADEDTSYFAREGAPTILAGRGYMFTRLDKRPSDLLEAAETSPPAEGDPNGSPE